MHSIRIVLPRCLAVAQSSNMIRSTVHPISKHRLCNMFPGPTRTASIVRTLCSKPPVAGSASDYVQQNKKEPDEASKVYYGTLTPQIRAVKVFSLATSIGGIVAQPILLEQASKIGGMPMIVAVCGFAGFFTFVTPILLHLVTKRYVTELHYDPVKQQYTATTITFFLQREKTNFKIEDVTVPEVGGLFTTFLVKNKAMFVDPQLFPDPTHYIKIMGYDKPIDFKFEEARQTGSSENPSKKDR
ncbi:transmembrane protein 70 homolog, mitochondrial [Anopheles ziemanni]|uniref:transmembrane protein 70 homolog, mitochondrial n=1 Tax=Anopheles coustani TaxID=139045 RepID=UPI00265AF915|nr:transmembrane protein 70 homolog, mitochondrial [Anopheles coustani]XP_058166570.1 transmembrane protein 70 homolog, mitochondrial [Anopheles ziemanni]